MTVNETISTQVAPTVVPRLQRKPQSYWGMAGQSLKRDRLTLSALAILIIFGLLALTAPIIANNFIGVGPDDTNPANALAKPYLNAYIASLIGTDTETAPQLLANADGIAHWFGTDQLGRDQFARLLYGGRVSLGIALAAGIITLLIGVSFGTIAGYFGGAIDDVVIWFINTLIAIPGIYLLIIVTAIFKPQPWTLTLFLGFLGWFTTARLIRGNVFKVRELDYVTAAHSIGTPRFRMVTQHILPNSIPIIIVNMAIDIGNLILIESALSFLGLGIQPPTATWGSMLNRAQNLFFLRDPETGEALAWHLIIEPGVLITLTVLALYLIGDGLRDALDPMMKNTK